MPALITGHPSRFTDFPSPLFQGAPSSITGRQPNAFGLNDMLGNVWEWNADVFRGSPAGGDAMQAGPGDGRSLRGGSWRNKARQIRVSNRGRLAPDDREDDDGFRCARRLPEPSSAGGRKA